MGVRFRRCTCAALHPQRADITKAAGLRVDRDSRRSSERQKARQERELVVAVLRQRAAAARGAHKALHVNRIELDAAIRVCVFVGIEELAGRANVAIRVCLPSLTDGIARRLAAMCSRFWVAANALCDAAHP